MATLPKRSNLTMAAFVLSLIAGISVVLEGLIRLGQGRSLEISRVTYKITDVGIYELGAIALLLGT